MAAIVKLAAPNFLTVLDQLEEYGSGFRVVAVYGKQALTTVQSTVVLGLGSGLLGDFMSYKIGLWTGGLVRIGKEIIMESPT
jgi:hypothetical protein